MNLCEHAKNIIFTPLLACLILLLSIDGIAQVNLGVGYTNKASDLGSSLSNEGVALRIGIDIIKGDLLVWGVEFGADLYNKSNRQFSESCTSGPCHFDITNKDTGWSLGTILKVYSQSPNVKLYGLGGFGFIQIRRYKKEFAVDDAGAILPNFSIESTFNGGEALQFHLGGGVIAQPENFPIGFYIEGRATYFLYSYSGGLSDSWNPTLVAGIRIPVGK